jgi:uncharacterized protein YcfL
MRPKKLILAFCVAAGMVAANGCNRSINTVERADPLGRPQVVNDRRIETDPTLSEKASVVRVYETKVGDLTKVQVDILNTRTTQREISYKFEWYDDAGMLVNSPMSDWKPQTMLGGEKVSLVSIAPNPRARDFRLKMKESKRD